MKKITILISTILLLMTITSCGDSKASPKSTEKITLNFVTQDDTESPTYAGYRAFAEKLSELSGGTMTVEFMQMTKFGSTKEMIDTMLNGTFDIVSAGYTDMRYAVPELGILGNTMKDFDHLVRIMDSKFGGELYAKMNDAGVIASSPWYMGTRRTTSNRPINSVADFKGLKMRTTPTGTNFATRMGADVYPIAFAELPQALAEGVVDAQENPMSIIEASKLYQWQNYIAFTEHAISTTGVFLSKPVYDSFTAEQKMWYNEAIQYGAETCTEIVRENEATLLDKFVNEYGMTATYPDREEILNLLLISREELVELFGEENVTTVETIE